MPRDGWGGGDVGRRGTSGVLEMEVNDQMEGFYRVKRTNLASKLDRFVSKRLNNCKIALVEKK